MRETALIGLALFLVGSGVWAGAPTPAFDLTILPPAEVGGVELPTVVARDLSNEGHVAGSAWNTFQIAAFLYTPDGRMVAVDPPGTFRSVGWLVNDRGQIYGESRQPREDFLFSEADGVVSIRESLPNPSGSLFVLGLNNTGTVIGWGSKTPLIYRSGGWRDARELHPELTGEVTVEALNDDGDFLLRKGLGPEPGSRFQRIENYVVRSSGTLHRFGSTGPLTLQVSPPNSAGQIVGGMVDKTEPLEAFAWTPQRGLVEVVVEGAVEAIADWSPVPDMVAGQARFAAKGRAFDALYVHSLDGSRPEFVVESKRFRRLARRNGFKRFRGVQAFQFNERLEFIGEILIGKKRLLPYFYRHGTGLFSIQSLVDKAGGGLKVTGVTDLNRLGQILIHGRTPSGRGASAILTPFDRLEAARGKR